MNTVKSKDGTTIAYDQSGKGPVLVLVGGALEHRAMDSETAHLAAFPVLSEHFTVIHYDRRGRGDSTDTKSVALEREIEDIEALINHVGGSAYLSGISSGAALAMEAAIKLGSSKVKKLAMYEAPYNSDEEARKAWVAYTKKLNSLLAEGRNADALISFMMLVGMTEDHVPYVKQMPQWSTWEAVAPTLAYDAAAVGYDASVPLDHAAKVTMPALVMNGEASFPFMATAAAALAETMPHGQHRTLAGQTHEVSAEALAPVLIEFFIAKS